MAVTVPRNILIVENDLEKCAKLVVIVKKFGPNVFVAPTEAHFTRFISTITFHGVILSARMPSSDNVSYVSKIASSPTGATAGVILTGDKADEQALDGAVKKGAAKFYYTWPISATSLFSSVEKLTGVSQRHAPRLRIIYKAQVTVWKETRSLIATSLSETGVFVRTNAPSPVGSIVKMVLDLPTSKPLELEGEVVRAIEPGHMKFMEPGMGIKFTNIEGPIQLGIRSFIESLLTVEIAEDIHV